MQRPCGSREHGICQGHERGQCGWGRVGGAGVMVMVRNAEIIMSKWLGMWVGFIK